MFRGGGRRIGWTNKGMQFGGAVKEPQSCCGVKVGSKVTPLLIQVLPDL